MAFRSERERLGVAVWVSPYWTNDSGTALLAKVTARREIRMNAWSSVMPARPAGRDSEPCKWLLNAIRSFAAANSCR